MKNLHILKVKYLGPTNFKGSRVRITSEWFNQSVTIPYDYSANDCVEVAANFLKNAGFEIIRQGEGIILNYLISNTFQKLKK